MTRRARRASLLAAAVVLLTASVASAESTTEMLSACQCSSNMHGAPLGTFTKISLTSRFAR